MSNTVTDAYIGSTEYGYNTRGHLTSVVNEIGGNTYGQYYSYSNTGVAGAAENAADGLPTRYTALGYVTDYSYDSLNRLTKRNVDLDNDIQTLYYYKNAELRQGYTTSQISSENLDGTTFAYTYDNMGNITEIKKNGNKYREYTYDDLGQLTKEIQHDNNKTINYVYNHLGNISYKTETITNPQTNAQTVKTINYRYGNDGKTGWNYLLTGYDIDGNGVDENEKISYDKIGNPIIYRGAEMAWKGRQLTGYAKNGTMSTFSYDADGLRATKTVGGVKTVYQYVGDKLYYEKRGESQEFYYFYDSYGNLATIYYGYNNGTTTSRAIYHTLTNAQGDVIAIYNNTGALVARYEYDAWGNVLSVKDASGNAITQQNHIANANPIRYRGYYYDADLGLYYLQSRYYDSETGRFINSDSITDSGAGILGYNTFIYCANNPVNSSDPSGHECVCVTHRVHPKHVCNSPSEEYILEYPSNRVDITTEGKAFMEKNANEIIEYKEEKGTIAAMFYFYQKVDDDCDWDIKTKNDWMFEDGKYYVFDGKVLRFDDMGNINFGYVGAVLFPEEFLCFGAGFNQISKFGFQFGDISTWFDDPRDNSMVKYGYNLYVSTGGI